MNTYFKRSFIAGTAALCTLTAALPTLPTYAEDIATLESKTAALQAQLSGLNQEMVSISDQITTTQMQVEITNGEILRTQEALATAQADEAKQYEDMKTRIKYMYETGNATLLEMLFSAETMTDFLNKADFIQNISSYDREMLEELQALQEEIAMEEATLIDQQTSLTELQTTLEGRQAALQATAAATSTDLGLLSPHSLPSSAQRKRSLPHRKPRRKPKSRMRLRIMGLPINQIPTNRTKITPITVPAATIPEPPHRYGSSGRTIRSGERWQFRRR